MRVACTALALAGAVSLCPAAASGQTVLTLTDVLARAREQAPQIVSARLALEEARGRVTGASLRLQSNPEIDVSVGNRQGSSRAFDGPPARRRADVRAAWSCGRHGSPARRPNSIRAWPRPRKRRATFFARLPRGSTRRCLPTERIRLLAASEELANAVFQTADRRYRAGELAVLDVNLARCVAGPCARRPRGRRGGARRRSRRAAGPVRHRQERSRCRAAWPWPLRRTPRRSRNRWTSVPNCASLAGAIREADADVSLAETLSKPDYGVGLRYQREDGDHIVLGGVTVTLPVFSKGQELRAVGSARGARLRAELDAARARVRIELQTALAAYERRVAAARVLEAEALPASTRTTP